MNRICQLRNKKGLTQAGLGEIVGKSLHAISKWETGRNQPSQEDLVTMCRFFGVSMEYLLGVNDSTLISERGQVFMDTSKEKYGEQGIKEAQELLADIQSLFFGGVVPAEDKDKVFQLITEMYWEAKDAQKSNGDKDRK